MAAPSWTTPKTWVTGETVPADGSSGLNTQIRDNTLCVSEHILAQVYATAAAATIDLAQIPPGYESLRLEVDGRVTAALSVANIGLQFSTSTAASPTFDTSTNYDWHHMVSVGVGATGERVGGSSYAQIGTFPGGSASTGFHGSASVTIPSYVRTIFNKTIVSIGASISGTTAADSIVAVEHSRWRNNDAIRAVRVMTIGGTNLSSGTVATLYGSRTTATST